MSKLSDEKKGIAGLMLNHIPSVDPYDKVVAPNWILYIEGYKNAADHLVDCAVESYPAGMAVYPIVFLYRQYIELQLKDMLQMLYKYHTLPCRIPITHDLIQIWHKVRHLVERIDKSFWGIEHYDHIEARIREFALIDKGSFSFRYPLDAEGNLSLGNINEDIGGKALNIFQMKCVINSIYEILRAQSETLYMEYGVE